MTADTELIAVGITKIGTVVVGMIVRAKAGRALGASTSASAASWQWSTGGAIGRQQGDHLAVAGRGGLAIERPADQEQRRATPGAIQPSQPFSRSLT